MNHWLELYVIAVIHLGAIPAVGYPLLWSRRGTWKDSRVGRALMSHARAMAALFLVSLLNVWAPGAWWAWAYTATVTWVTVTLFRQFIVLVSVTRERDRKHVPD